MPQMRSVKVSAGKGKYQVQLAALMTGNGVILSLLGGEKPHVGAVAVSLPRKSLAEARRLSATTSVFTLLGHKEDEIAKPAAEEAARRLNQPVVVVAGMHVDGASRREIERLSSNAMLAVKKFLEELKDR